MAPMAAGTLRAGGVASLDLLWDHDFRLMKETGDNAKVLTAGVSDFNVLNRTNYTNYIGTVNSSLFTQPTAALSWRQLQFSLGFHF
jgi:hypothetical protein